MGEFYEHRSLCCPLYGKTDDTALKRPEKCRCPRRVWKKDRR